MDGVVDESDNSITTASDRVIATDGEIACELLESGVHAEFDLLHIGDQHLVTVKEVQQLSVPVPNAIGPLQLNCRNLPTSKAGPGAVALVWAGKLGSNRAPRREGRTRALHVGGLRLPGGCYRWDRGGACGAAPRDQPPVVCSGMDSSAEAVSPLVAHHAQKGNSTSVGTTVTN